MSVPLPTPLGPHTTSGFAGGSRLVMLPDRVMLRPNDFVPDEFCLGGGSGSAPLPPPAGAAGSAAAATGCCAVDAAAGSAEGDAVLAALTLLLQPMDDWRTLRALAGPRDSALPFASNGRAVPSVARPVRARRPRRRSE